MGNLLSVSILVDQIASQLWTCIVGEAKHTLKLKQNLQALEDDARRLRETRDDVKRKVDLEEQQQFKSLAQVRGRLSRVEEEITEAEKLILEGPQQVNRLCFGGCFSKNCCSSYKFGREVAGKITNLSDLMSEGNFKEVVGKVHVASVHQRPIDLTVGLEEKFDEV